MRINSGNVRMEAQGRMRDEGPGAHAH
jgi:hypothetical protein